jgi:hypothetical protein
MNTSPVFSFTCVTPLCCSIRACTHKFRDHYSSLLLLCVWTSVGFALQQAKSLRTAIAVLLTKRGGEKNETTTMDEWRMRSESVTVVYSHPFVPILIGDSPHSPAGIPNHLLVTLARAASRGAPGTGARMLSAPGRPCPTCAPSAAPQAPRSATVRLPDSECLPRRKPLAGMR